MKNELFDGKLNAYKEAAQQVIKANDERRISFNRINSTPSMENFDKFIASAENMNDKLSSFRELYSELNGPSETRRSLISSQKKVLEDVNRDICKDFTDNKAARGLLDNKNSRSYRTLPESVECEIRVNDTEMSRAAYSKRILESPLSEMTELKNTMEEHIDDLAATIDRFRKDYAGGAMTFLEYRDFFSSVKSRLDDILHNAENAVSAAANTRDAYREVTDRLLYIKGDVRWQNYSEKLDMPYSDSWEEPYTKTKFNKQVFNAVNDLSADINRIEKYYGHIDQAEKYGGKLYTAISKCRQELDSRSGLNGKTVPSLEKYSKEELTDKYAQLKTKENAFFGEVCKMTDKLMETVTKNYDRVQGVHGIMKEPQKDLRNWSRSISDNKRSQGGGMTERSLNAQKDMMKKTLPVTER